MLGRVGARRPRFSAVPRSARRRSSPISLPIASCTDPLASRVARPRSTRSCRWRSSLRSCRGLLLGCSRAATPLAVEAARAGPGDRGDAAVDPDLGVDARDVVAHGVARDVERARDRLVVVARGRSAPARRVRARSGRRARHRRHRVCGARSRASLSMIERLNQLVSFITASIASTSSSSVALRWVMSWNAHSTQASSPSVDRLGRNEAVDRGAVLGRDPRLVAAQVATAVDRRLDLATHACCCPTARHRPAGGR